MSEPTYPTPNNDEAVISANKNALNVPVEIVELGAGEGVADIRKWGGGVTYLELKSNSTGETVPILFCDGDISPPKINVTHAMVPYGANEGFASGQHGFPRWVDYRRVSYANNPDTSSEVGALSEVILEAEQGERGLSLTRSFELEPETFLITNTIHNSSEVNVQTSIGEHVYFNLEDGNYQTLRVDDKALPDILGEDSYEVLAEGGTLYYGLPEGGIDVRFPQGHTVNINADFIGETKYPLAVLFWQRPGTESICIEPVVGVSPEEANDGVLVKPGFNASLKTILTLI